MLLYVTILWLNGITFSNISTKQRDFIILINEVESSTSFILTTLSFTRFHTFVDYCWDVHVIHLNFVVYDFVKYHLNRIKDRINGKDIASKSFIGILFS